MTVIVDINVLHYSACHCSESNIPNLATFVFGAKVVPVSWLKIKELLCGCVRGPCLGKQPRLCFRICIHEIHRGD